VVVVVLLLLSLVLLPESVGTTTNSQFPELLLPVYPDGQTWHTLSKKNNPDAHVLQLEDVVTHVVHVLAQSVHPVVVDWKEPLGHVLTQSLLYSKNIPEHDEHVEVVVAQLNHGLAQSVHTLFTSVLVVPQSAVQTPPVSKNGVVEVVIQLKQEVLLLQVVHGETHVWHVVESRYEVLGQVV
jgi:hypothetical protein